MSATVDAGRRRRDRIFPDQHGAWGFLVLPLVLGATAAGWSWSLIPVSAAWVAAYPLTWALSGRLAAPRRRERFSRALWLWASIALPLMLVSVMLRPWLVWVGAVYVVPLAVDVLFARARRQRDLTNDLVLVAACTAAVPITAAVAAGGGGWVPPWSAMAAADVALATLLCALTLVGSTLHVKSLIRERANPSYTHASRAFAAVSIPVMLAASFATASSPWLAVPCVILWLRARFLHDPTWRPSRIGVVELAAFVLVAVSAALTL